MNDDFGVPVEVDRQVFAAQLQLHGAFRDSLRVGAWVGALLATAKDACGHGQFLDWLNKHFDGSARHAQHLMQVARAYPDPDKIPAISLREALRLLAGKAAKQKAVLAHERLSGETCSVMLATFPEVLKLIETRTIGPLEVEGVTARHPVMKAAKKLAADIRRLRELVTNLRAPERHEGHRSVQPSNERTSS